MQGAALGLFGKAAQRARQLGDAVLQFGGAAQPFDAFALSGALGPPGQNHRDKQQHNGQPAARHEEVEQGDGRIADAEKNLSGLHFGNVSAIRRKQSGPSSPTG